jgi:hypothetical protein
MSSDENGRLHVLTPGGPHSLLANYIFLTPCIENKKANVYEVSTRAILDRFSNTAALDVWWRVAASPGTNVTRSRNGLAGSFS